MNISNTLLNSYREYRKEKACGKQIQAVYIDKQASFETTEPQMAGQWFEYEATGAKLRNGIIPSPITTSKGAKAAITKHLEGQLENFKRIYSNINIVDNSLTLEYEEDGLNYKGVLDVVAEDVYNGVHIRDIKCSGLIDNIWEETGWGMLLGDNYKPRKKHLSQAILYIVLWYKTTGNIVPFYFDVFSNKNPNDCKTIKILIDEHEIDYHWEEISIEAKSLVDELKKGDLKARPSMSRCRKCPVEDCKFKTDIPEVEVIHL